MKLSLLGGILLARLCAAVSLVSAGEGLSGIPEDKLRELESLHHTAEDMVAQNKFREALDVYTDIILLEPDDEVAYTHMGNAYLILGDFDRAKKSYEMALNINPDDNAAAAGLSRIKDPDRPRPV